MKSNLFSHAANWVFIGFMFLGIAIGMYFNQTAIGTLAGMGIGFIARALIGLNTEKEKTKKTIQL